MLNYLDDLGMFTSSGGQFVGHTFTEIQAYEHQTGVQLDAWDSITLAQLSRTAAHWANISTNKDTPNPLGASAEDESARVQRISNAIDSKIFGKRK